MADTTFLDANIFMYAAGTPHPYKDPCVHILADVETGILSAVVNTEILQELLYRYSHIKLASKGIQPCRDILKYPVAILSVTDADIRLAIDLFESHHPTGLKPRDAIHAATMKNNGIIRIMSADTDFDNLDFVTRIDPLAYQSLSKP
ncbi:MAG: type II toxin-antitoxin system VapC family toxin [candidate division KSB1 bacterium]|nr:type II toxin-antitoxin system VapC family toxin [candidate division KSB1 bacterium]MDZ7303835.1 type II toxin-antitoxin system VapC family toxin [candidate division KSB1 bacterium]MDZ7312736.1 type II toxin-antitoxin system VapC family toxin [candidate division KSB1 bacterium]